MPSRRQSRRCRTSDRWTPGSDRECPEGASAAPVGLTSELEKPESESSPAPEEYVRGEPSSPCTPPQRMTPRSVSPEPSRLSQPCWPYFSPSLPRREGSPLP